MTEFIFWNIKVSFSSIKYWLFSRILSLALSGVANLVRCKPVASKKKYLERACLGVNKTQRKTELSNKESSDDIWGHGSPALRRGGPTSDFLVVSQYTSYPYLLTDLLYLPTYVFMYLFIMVNLSASSGVFLTFPLSKLALSPYPQLLLSMLSSSQYGSLLSVDLWPFWSTPESSRPWLWNF